MIAHLGYAGASSVLLAVGMMLVPALGRAAEADPCQRILSPALERATVFEPGDKLGVAGGREVTGADLLSRADGDLGVQAKDFCVQARNFESKFVRLRWQLLESEFEKLLDERALEQEAEARNTTSFDLLKDVPSPVILDTDIRQFYESRKASIGEPFETAAPKILEFLTNEGADRELRKYFDALRSKYGVEGRLPPLREPVGQAGPSRGPASAPIVIVEFADFECPFCAKSVATLDALLAAYPGQIRHVYRNFPLASIHPNAAMAAAAAACTNDQGKFWEMRNWLFSKQRTLDAESVRGAALALGVDGAAFDACMEDGSKQDLVRADTIEALSLGVEGTPTLFINGRYVTGAVPLERLKRMVEEELAGATAGRVPPNG